MKIGEVEKDSHLIVKVFSKMMKDGEEVRSPKSLDFPVKIQKVYPTGDNGYCHVIIPSKDGTKMNRRHAYRLEIHAPANIYVGQSDEQVGGTVRDVSATGFAIITHKDGIRRGESVRAETLNQELEMPLAGVCVRKKTIAKDKFLYGCKLKYEDPNLRKFINEKQRARMKTE